MGHDPQIVVVSRGDTAFHHAVPRLTGEERAIVAVGQRLIDISGAGEAVRCIIGESERAAGHLDGVQAAGRVVLQAQRANAAVGDMGELLVRVVGVDDIACPSLT